MNFNLDSDEVAFFDTHLDGVLYLSRAQFDVTHKEEKVLYVVDEADGFSLYLGEKELFSGLSQLTQYREAIRELENDLLSVKRRLGMLNYQFPDVNGDGEAGADDVSYLEEFSARLGAGQYEEYDGIEAKWNAYAAEKGLENSHYISDVNGDGEMRADDVAAIQLFISECGAGKYVNDEDGFREFMLDYHNAIFGTNISGIRVVQEAHFKGGNIEIKPDILYLVKAGSSLRMYLGDAPVSGGGSSVVGTMSRAYSGVSGTSGTMEWLEEKEA